MSSDIVLCRCGNVQIASSHRCSRCIRQDQELDDEMERSASIDAIPALMGRIKLLEKDVEDLKLNSGCDCQCRGRGV